MPGRRIIGVDVGATKLLAGAVDTDCFVHRRAQRSVSGLDQSSLVDAVGAVVHEIAALAGGETEAVGFALPGRIDPHSGRIMSSELPALRGVPFADLMAERLGVPTVAGNVGNLAALAEHRAGAARARNHALVLTLGDSVTGGIIRDGELDRGATEAARLEPLVAAAALTREADRIAAAQPESALAHAHAELRPALVIELAHDGDAAAGEVLALVGTRLGAALAELVSTLGLEVVVIGGDVLGAGERLLGPAQAQLQVPILAARFGIEAGMVGAAVLARQSLTAGNRA